LLVYIGSLAQASGETTTPVGWLLKAFALTSAVVTTIYLARVARRTLVKKLPSPSDGKEPAGRVK
jgi:hypothetical protein